MSKNTLTHTFTHSFFDKHGRDQLVVSSAAAAIDLNLMNIEAQLKISMAAATVFPTTNQTGRPPRPHTHTHMHAHTPHTHKNIHKHKHMALGELVRTTLTSLGSPDHLHPEDCGKLRVMWVGF